MKKQQGSWNSGNRQHDKSSFPLYVHRTTTTYYLLFLVTLHFIALYFINLKYMII